MLEKTQNDDDDDDNVHTFILLRVPWFDFFEASKMLTPQGHQWSAGHFLNDMQYQPFPLLFFGFSGL